MIPDSRHGVIGAAVGSQRGLHPPEAVQIRAMLFLIQKLLAVVLAMDVQKLSADLAQLGNSQRAAIGAADVLAVPADLPLQQQIAILVRCDAVVSQSRQCGRDLRKNGADKGLVRAGPDQFPGGPSAQNGAHSVDHNGLAGTGLAGQGVEAGAEGYIRRLDHCDIFNMKQFQHVPRLPSEWVSAGGLQHFPDLLAEGLRTGVVLHDHEDRVLPCQRTHHAVDIHVIQGLAGAAGQTGQRLEHHDVLGAVHAGDALMEDGAQLVRNVQTGTAAGNRVFVGAVARRLLHQMKLLDVPGDGGLGTGHAPLPQLLQELLLGLDVFLCDDVKDHGLAIVFHD